MLLDTIIYILYHSWLDDLVLHAESDRRNLIAISVVSNSRSRLLFKRRCFLAEAETPSPTPDSTHEEEDFLKVCTFAFPWQNVPCTAGSLTGLFKLTIAAGIMSAYGAITKSHIFDGVLPSTVWSTGGLKVEGDSEAVVNHISLHHLTLKDARGYDGLVNYLRSVFAGVVEEGRTYPQEGEITPDSFEAYFFAGDVLVGIVMPKGALSPDGSQFQARDQALASASESWEANIAGFYYVSISPNS